ncbi:hypothetical protein K9N68_28725 [Kovacikia minuta CCNUW1]|uniref:hypothetical protein n=1 Tax=Kovacikia minuta TaxID=2931930 RepID=UPI001CCC1AF5|nr:hypothetical protein [Kovacikia minuta]UBF25522.1 hypothetical protein K9N68_28725 [Kovacikia minuta CCNUW1]
MSEADNPNRDPGLPESVQSVDESAASVDLQASGSSPKAADEAGWQTLDFPGAISVDAIPRSQSPDVETLASDPEVVSALASLAGEALPEPSDPQSNAEVETVEMATKPKLHGVASAQEISQQDNQFAGLLQQLQRENSELHDRITQLEQDLAQQQIEFQLEVARSLHRDTADSAHLPVPDIHPVQDLVAAQERISQLFRELDLSQQTAQRQQILVETLSQQLESSQERIAQLERDCALAQQRYNEQVQQLLQAENTCRDLRMRLHRQQRHTLQFKAALEKCLEMPTTYRQTHFMPDLQSDDESSDASAAIVAASAQPLTPKNQPVRPWSVSSGLQDTDDPALADNFAALPRFLSKLVNPDTADGLNLTDAAAVSPWDEPASGEAQATADWMNLIFVETPDSQSHLANDPQSVNSIFDLSPFLEGEATVSGVSAAQESEDSMTQKPNVDRKDQDLLQMLAAVPLDSDELGSPLGAFQWGQPSHTEETLWDDLAKLIDSPAPSEDAPAKSQDAAVASGTGVDADTAQVNDRPLQASPSNQIKPFPTIEVASDQEALAPDAATGNTADQETVSPVKKTPQLASWKPRSDKSATRNTHLRSIAPQSPVKNTPMPAADKVSVAAAQSQPEAAGSSGSFNSELISGSWPSPVVYPLRPSRKLKSLAAVELPSFPKAR